MAPCGRHVSGGQAAAHGDSQHRVVAQRHRSRQRRHFAIVHHVERNAAPTPPAVRKRGAARGSRNRSRRHGAVERAHPHFVVHVHARGAAADGIHPRQMRGRAPQRIVDAVEVVLRVGLRAGIPRHFLAEDHLAIRHRRALAVAGAQVEADPVAVQVPAQRRGGFPLRRRGVEAALRERHRPPVDALAHELEIEGAGAFRRIHGAQIFAPVRGVPGDGDATAALLPQQKFQQPLDVAAVQRGVPAFRRQDAGAEHRDRPVAALQRQGHRLTAARFPATACANARFHSEAGANSGSRTGRNLGAIFI